MPIGYETGRTDPKSNSAASDVAASNKSSQTPQANAQNVPQGRANSRGASVISGAGSRGRRVVTGKLGKASFR